MTTTLVIGIGNYDRGDDGAGLAVAERIRAAHLPGVGIIQLDGDQLGLLDAWADAADVYVIDAVCSGSPPGTVFHFDAARPLPTRFRYRGTHTFSLADVIELARELGTLPPRLTGYGIEGCRFEIGTALSPEITGAVEAVANCLLRELRQPSDLRGRGELRDGG
jgi:hydrogenase maturation protease